MKTTAAKENVSKSLSSKGFFNKKGEGGIASTSSKVEQPLFFRNSMSKKSSIDSSISGGNNTGPTYFFKPKAFVQPKLTINEPSDKYEQEADTRADRAMNQIAGGGAYPGIQLMCTECAAEQKEGNIPKIGEGMMEDEDSPPEVQTIEESGRISRSVRLDSVPGFKNPNHKPGSKNQLQKFHHSPSKQIQMVPDSCDEPLSMNKIVSGSFRGGLTINDYYPVLVSRGYPANAGPFDTGTRVGAIVQLFGVIPSPCRPEQFSFAQTVTYRNRVTNGRRHPREGVVQDDIAKSGRNFDTPPERQDFLGEGYNISMADPPSIGYNATMNAESDKDFVTSLVGPGGRKSVSWSTSIRVVDGSVTRNEIT
ncbi:MAG: hypothetical protein WD398_07165 [Cyclobacteriaceae bacterium]